MNRVYKHYGTWEASEKDDGDLKVSTAERTILVPAAVFNGPNVMGVFDWIEENSALERQ